MKKINLSEKILQREMVERIFFLMLGTFLLGVNYNLFLAPNNLVIGGLSGLALIFEQLWHWNIQIFIYVGTFLMILLSFIFLGKEKTKGTIIGGILYPLMISLTLPLTEILKNYIIIDNELLIILVAGLIQGFAIGVIFKYGFTTGGLDTMTYLLNKYGHMSEGNSNIFIQTIVILLGGFTFGINKMIYALIILIIYSSLVDKILIGISNSKLFFIYTNKVDKVKDYILKELHTGVTLLHGQGGFSKKNNRVLMCVVPNRDYYLFKEIVLEIDPDAFFVINDCYEVQGGQRRNLPHK